MKEEKRILRGRRKKKKDKERKKMCLECFEKEVTPPARIHEDCNS